MLPKTERLRLMSIPKRMVYHPSKDKTLDRFIKDVTKDRDNLISHPDSDDCEHRLAELNERIAQLEALKTKYPEWGPDFEYRKTALARIPNEGWRDCLETLDEIFGVLLESLIYFNHKMPISKLAIATAKEVLVVQQTAILNDLKTIPDWGAGGGPTWFWDTETWGNTHFPEAKQPLRFGVAYYCGFEYEELILFKRKNQRWPNRDEMDRIRRVVVFYDSHYLERTTEATKASTKLIKRYAETHSYNTETKAWVEHLPGLTKTDHVPIEVMTRDDFVKSILWSKHHIHGDILMPVTFIGLNQIFDFGRIAYRMGYGQGQDFYGGASLFFDRAKRIDRTKRQAENEPYLRAKKVGPSKFMMEMYWVENKRMQAFRFIDIRHLTKAFLGAQQSASMNSLCDLFKIERKEEVEHFKPLTNEYLEYGIHDVERTQSIYHRFRTIYDRHGLTTDISRILSEASLGKAYFKKLNIRSFLDYLKSLPDDGKEEMLTSCGIAMEAMAGGRSEGHWRGEILEGRQYDAKSMYPLTNYLLALQRFQIAKTIKVRRILGDDNEHAQFLKTVTVRDNPNGCQTLLGLNKQLNFETWRKCPFYVKIDRSENCPKTILPTRVLYGEFPDDPVSRDLNAEQQRAEHVQAAINIGLNEVSSGPPRWISALDYISSKLLTGECPKILEIMYFEAEGVQDDLKTIDFFGDKRFTIDLRKDDFFKRVIDMRSGFKAFMGALEQLVKDKDKLSENERYILNTEAANEANELDLRDAINRNASRRFDWT